MNKHRNTQDFKVYFAFILPYTFILYIIKIYIKDK